MVNPLHATAPTFPRAASPYYPSSRRFLDPIYLRIEEVPGADRVEDMARLSAAGRQLTDGSTIDRDAVWRHKLDALERIWDARPPLDRFEEWLQHEDESLTDFSTWCVLSEHLGAGWRDWPAEYRHPSSPTVKRFREDRYQRIRFYSWLQWATRRQLSEAGSRLRLIQDLPIGVDPGGVDAWVWQDLFVLDASVGAPPDEFNVQGQDWGLPPLVPWKLAGAGYRPFIHTIRSSLRPGEGCGSTT